MFRGGGGRSTTLRPLPNPPPAVLLVPQHVLQRAADALAERRALAPSCSATPQVNRTATRLPPRLLLSRTRMGGPVITSRSPHPCCWRPGWRPALLPMSSQTTHPDAEPPTPPSHSPSHFYQSFSQSFPREKNAASHPPSHFSRSSSLVSLCVSPDGWRGNIETLGKINRRAEEVRAQHSIPISVSISIGIPPDSEIREITWGGQRACRCTENQSGFQPDQPLMQ